MPVRPGRALTRTGLALSLMLASVVLMAAPASAHTLGDAVVSERGCGWPNGAYTVLRRVDLWDDGNNMPLADVYVLWSGSYRENCVVTLRVGRAHGVATDTRAVLERQGMETVEDLGVYAHYAAASGYAAGTCIRWRGGVRAIYGGRIYEVTDTQWRYCD